MQLRSSPLRRRRPADDQGRPRRTDRKGGKGSAGYQGRDEPSREEVLRAEEL